MYQRAGLWVVLLVGVVLLANCTGNTATNDATPTTAPNAAAPTSAPSDAAPTTAPSDAAPTISAGIAPELLAAFAPLPAEATPADHQLTDAQITLGRMLYYEPRLSISQQMSCNSCHALDRYGVDNEPTSPGHAGQRGDRNSPTVYNAALHVAQFWDGRAADVEAQAQGPITNPVEMGMPGPEQVEQVLRSIAGYRPLFDAAFPGDPNPITYQNAARAIGAFERRLITPDRFDRFLQGDRSQLNGQEQRGLKAFVEVGCISCHSGAAVGGGMYQKLGLVEPYPVTDEGRFKVTNQESDRYVFKVPSLRNVAQTGPYLHDGSVRTLDEAVRLMGRYQLGQALTDEQVADIVAFLGSLTGELPEEYIAPPQLPPGDPAVTPSASAP